MYFTVNRNPTTMSTQKNLPVPQSPSQRPATFPIHLLWRATGCDVKNPPVLCRSVQTGDKSLSYGKADIACTPMREDTQQWVPTNRE